MRIPPGFLGTRADVLMDVILIAMSLTPFVLAWSIGLARGGAYTRHRAVQTGLLVVLLVAVVLFEADVRTSGGSGAFLAGSRWRGTPQLAWFLRVHIAVAVTSFALWTFVVANAWLRRLEPRPEFFGPAHRRTGYAIWAGVTFTSVSGAALYWLCFVS